MNLNPTKEPTQHATRIIAKKMSFQLLVMAAIVGLLVSATWLYDFLAKDPVTNVTGTVIDRKFVEAPAPDQSMYMLVITSGKNVWSARVDSSYFYSIDENDRLPLTRWIGPVSGHAYHTQIDRLHIPDISQLQKATMIR